MMNDKMKVLYLMLCLFLCHKGAASTLTQREDTVLYSTTFILEALPANTPHDANIFISGTFCDWYPDVALNKLLKNKEGYYKITVNHSLASFEYKFTRGSWKSVEGRTNGRARPNREFYAGSREEIIRIKVDSWEDISTGSYNIYMYILFLAAIQGFLLIIAINNIGNKNKKANGTLSMLLFLITIALLGRASTFDPQIFNWQPKFILIPEILLFTYGPLFYYYIHKLLIVDTPGKKLYLLNFVPLIVQIIIYAPYLLLPNQTFIYKIIDQNLFPFFAITGALAFASSTIYWMLSRKLIKDFQQMPGITEYQNKYIRFLTGVIHIKAVYLVLWLSIMLVYIVGKTIGMDTLSVAEKIIDVLWLLFSFIIFALGYFAIKHPEVLREKERYKQQVLDKSEAEEIMEKLEHVINHKKIFLNPDLTLNDLAAEIRTSSHTLSRVINEHYDQTFGGYINHHRIQEFVRKAREENSSSFLGLALDVGFSSKTTFNRAFKKEFNMTPREYLKNLD